MPFYVTLFKSQLIGVRVVQEVFHIQCLDDVSFMYSMLSRCVKKKCMYISHLRPVLLNAKVLYYSNLNVCEQDVCTHTVSTFQSGFNTALLQGVWSLYMTWICDSDRCNVFQYTQPDSESIRW